MGSKSRGADPANVIESLVFNLLDVFDQGRDLYKTLRLKEKRDHGLIQKTKGYPDPRRSDYLDEDDVAGDESIVLDKAAVTREFELGFEDLALQFAVGDVITQTALQSQIIALQSTIISTFLYGPSSPDPISAHLSTLLTASRSAGTTTVDALHAQHQRMLSQLPPSARPFTGPSPRSPVAAPPPPLPLPYPVTHTSESSNSSTALVKVAKTVAYPTEPPPPPSSHSRSRTPTYPTIHSMGTRPRMNRTDTESTAFSGPTSYDTNTTSHSLFCLYAIDLQRHPRQQLADTVTQDPSPYCPYCNRTLHLSPGRSWEVFKDDASGGERTFRIQNRFVVKCHRDGNDGGYSCVLCSQDQRSGNETVCGDVKALVRHVWMDHSARDLQLEEDIVEVIDEKVDRRRDSGFGGVGRSRSVGPSSDRGRDRDGRRPLKREYKVVEYRRRPEER